MKKAMYIGVDVGATKVSFVLLEQNKVVADHKITTPKTKKEFIKALEENINKLKGELRIKKIGIGIPGVLNKEKNLILTCPNLKYLNKTRLAKIIEKKMRTKTVMENDAKCFTLAESTLGAGKNEKIVLGITLGTGVGGGLVIKDKNNKIDIYQGTFGGASEIGHMTIEAFGRKCSCGNKGCLELYCSSKFFKQKKISSLETEKKAKKRDMKALAVFKEYGQWLGVGIANVINLIEPDIIILGGGIANAWPYFLKATKQELKKRVGLSDNKKEVKIKITQLQGKAGAIGAGLVAELKL